MADVNIDGIVTWLKNWFYDKAEVNTIANSKANLNQGQANKNVVTNGSGEITVEDKPVIPVDVSELTDTHNTAFTPKSHNQASNTITDNNTYANIGNTSNTQESINSAINTKLGSIDFEFIKVVTTLPTASADTLNKLYIVVGNETDVYYT